MKTVQHTYINKNHRKVRIRHVKDHATVKISDDIAPFIYKTLKARMKTKLTSFLFSFLV